MAQTAELKTPPTRRPWKRGGVVYRNGAERTINIGVEGREWAVGSFSCVLPNDPIDDEKREAEHVANADLMLLAVNNHDALLKALQGVLRVADRKTVEFDAARAAIEKASAPTS